MGCVSDFFTYETTKSVVVKSWTIGIINRVVQLLIFTYFVGWVFLHEKAYQNRDTALESSVMTKVKGFGVYNDRIMDVADFVTPTQGASIFCVITKLITTENQVQGYCPESEPKYKCKSDSDCSRYLGTSGGNGIKTGRCVGYNNTFKTCEIRGWCPAEIDSVAIEPMLEAENFTIFIKNSIRFPMFNFTKGNLLPNITQSYIKSCNFDPINNIYCPIFRLGDVVRFAGEDFYKLANKGMKGGDNAYSDSDDDQHDAYLERMKQEGKIREEAANDSSDDSGDETDESFNPGEEDDDVAEEYDSNASESESSGEGGGSDDEEERKKPAKKPKLVKEKVERKPRKKAEGKKQKDPGAPKRPLSTYMLWLNANRDKIRAEYPGISITEVSKKAGELWKNMTKENKEEWDRKAEEAKRDYEKAMKVYKESGGGTFSTATPKKDKKSSSKGKGRDKKSKPSSKSSSATKSPAKATAGENESFKSKEFVSSDESSGESDQGKKSEGSDDEEIASTPPSSADSGSD